MRTKRLCLSLLAFFAICFQSTAQETVPEAPESPTPATVDSTPEVQIMGFCATEIPRAHEENPPVFPYQQRSTIEYNLDRTLSITVWIVANALDSYNYSEAEATTTWETNVNPYFEPIGMSFEVCNVEYITNYNFDVLSREVDEDGNSEELNLFAQHYHPNTINVYYIQELDNEPEVDGYAFFPGGPDIIVMRKGHGQWTPHHEMGHFFGLYHPFENSLGWELVDGSNCDTTGDLVCDTPADINGMTNGCQYIDPTTDANGDYYTPFLSNIMSYYDDECICRFTHDQYNRMAWMYLNQRNYLW